MEEKMNNTLSDIIKVYIAQMDSAIQISKVLCEHSKDNELTGDHIICGLIYRLMIPMKDNEIKDSLMKADDILNGSDEDEDEYESDEELHSEMLHYKIPEISRKIKSNHCNCEICSQVRVCLLNYHTFEPSDQLAVKFKHSIEETCEKHKIFI